MHLIKLFKSKNSKIEQALKQIAGTNLITIQKKCYELTVFLSDQKKNMKQATEKFRQYQEIIRVELNEMYFELFIKKGTEIQAEWLKYIQEIDR